MKEVTLLAWTVKWSSMPGKEDLYFWDSEQDHSDVFSDEDNFCNFFV